MKKNVKQSVPMYLPNPNSLASRKAKAKMSRLESLGNMMAEKIKAHDIKM